MTEQPPEMALIEGLRLKHPKMSVSKAAKLAAMSEGRWRQLAKGYQQVTPDTRVPTNAPAETLARMARAVGATAEDLEAANRTDAAQILLSAEQQQQLDAPAASPTPDSKPYDRVEGARHYMSHQWSLAEELASALAVTSQPADVVRAVKRLVSIYGALVVDRVIAFDISVEDRDMVLGEFYRRRDAVTKQLGEINAVEVAETAGAPAEAERQPEEVSPRSAGEVKDDDGLQGGHQPGKLGDGEGDGRGDVAGGEDPTPKAL